MCMCMWTCMCIWTCMCLCKCLCMCTCILVCILRVCGCMCTYNVQLCPCCVCLSVCLCVRAHVGICVSKWQLVLEKHLWMANPEPTLAGARLVNYICSTRQVPSPNISNKCVRFSIWDDFWCCLALWTNDCHICRSILNAIKTSQMAQWNFVTRIYILQKDTKLVQWADYLQAWPRSQLQHAHCIQRPHLWQSKLPVIVRAQHARSSWKLKLEFRWVAEPPRENKSLKVHPNNRQNIVCAIAHKKISALVWNYDGPCRPKDGRIRINSMRIWLECRSEQHRMASNTGEYHRILLNTPQHRYGWIPSDPIMKDIKGLHDSPFRTTNIYKRHELRGQSRWIKI